MSPELHHLGAQVEVKNSKFKFILNGFIFTSCERLDPPMHRLQVMERIKTKVLLMKVKHGTGALKIFFRSHKNTDQ